MFNKIKLKYRTGDPVILTNVEDTKILSIPVGASTVNFP